MADFRDNVEKLCEVAPALRSLELRRPDQLSSDELRRLRIPIQVTGLDVSANRIESNGVADWLQELITSSQVNSINVGRNPIGTDVFGAMIACAVTHLNAGFASIVGEDLQAVLSGMRHGAEYIFEQLVDLNLGGNPIENEGLHEFASEPWSKLETLNLSSSGITSIAPLANPQHFPSLKELILRDNRIADWDQLDSEQTDFLARLKTLDLRNNPSAKRSHGI